jgi:hypothetical protein
MAAQDEGRDKVPPSKERVANARARGRVELRVREAREGKMKNGRWKRGIHRLAQIKRTMHHEGTGTK